MRPTHPLPLVLLLALFAGCDDIHLGDPWDDVPLGVSRLEIAEVESASGAEISATLPELPATAPPTAIFFELPDGALLDWLDVYECGGGCDERPPTIEECGCAISDTLVWSTYDEPCAESGEEGPPVPGPIQYGVSPPEFSSSGVAPKLSEDRTYIVSFWGHRVEDDGDYAELRGCRFFRVSNGAPIELQGTEE